MMLISRTQDKLDDVARSLGKLSLCVCVTCSVVWQNRGWCLPSVVHGAMWLASPSTSSLRCWRGGQGRGGAYLCLLFTPHMPFCLQMLKWGVVCFQFWQLCGHGRALLGEVCLTLSVCAFNYWCETHRCWLPVRSIPLALCMVECSHTHAISIQLIERGRWVTRTSAVCVFVFVCVCVCVGPHAVFHCFLRVLPEPWCSSHWTIA